MQDTTATVPHLMPLGISLEGWLTLAAIVAGPIVALWLQRIVERRRRVFDRKLTIFKELMATRATKLSVRHVEALNAIEVEFAASKDASGKAVFLKWREYLDHMNKTAGPNPEAAVLKVWADEGNKILVDLLHLMSKAVGLNYDKVSLANSIYYPKGHGDLEDEQAKLRRLLVELLDNKRAIGAHVFTGATPLQMTVVAPPSAGTPTASTVPPPT